MGQYFCGKLFYEVQTKLKRFFSFVCLIPFDTEFHYTLMLSSNKVKRQISPAVIVKQILGVHPDYEFGDNLDLKISIYI